MLVAALMPAFAVPETTARANIDLDEDLTANMDLQQEDGAGGGYSFKSGGSKSYSKGGSSKGSTGSSFWGTVGKGTKATFGGKSGSNTVKNGATRAAKFSSGWGDASLNEARNKFAPNVDTVITSKGKIIYNNPETGISVVYDKNGNYFRIEDTTRPIGRNYLDINGNDMNNEIVNGKTRGRSRADYQQVTHFNISDE